MRPCHKCAFESFGRLTTMSYCSCRMTVNNQDSCGLPKIVEGCCCGFVSRRVTLPMGKAALEAEKANG